MRAGTSNPSSGSYTSAGTGLIVSCVSAITLTDSQSLGSCSAGSATSTLSLQNSSGSTAYVTAEYSTDGGSNWTVHTDAQEADNLTITNGQTNTSLTVSVPDGSAIQWRYKSSNTSGNWTGLSYITASDMNSATVDCPYIDTTVSQALGSCSAGSATSTLTLANSNSANATAYFLVEYSVDGGSNWTQKAANQSVSQNGSATLTQSVADGTAITWRYKSSTSSGSFSGSYTTLSASSTVDCPTAVTVSGSQALGTCSGGAQTSTLTVTNTSGSTAYVKVEYSVNGGSSYSTANANATISNGTGSLFTQSVSDGSAITWRFTSSDTSNDFTGLTPTTLSASSTVDCPQAVTVSSSQSLGSCSSGAATSTLTVSNSSGSTAYVKVEYSTDGGSSYSTDSSNSAIVSGASSTFTQSVSHDSAITWRVTSSDTSNDFTGLTPTTISASSTVDLSLIHI